MFDFNLFLILWGLIGPHTYALKSLVKKGISNNNILSKWKMRFARFG